VSKTRHHTRFRCRHCSWQGVLGRAASHCPGCRRGPLQMVEKNVPDPKGPKDAEIARLQAIVNSLAERCYVQSEVLTGLAERRAP
jgi:hypothetical protein